MAPLPVITDCIRVAFRWQNGGIGRNAANVMHFLSTGYNITSLDTAIQANVTAAMWGHTNNTTFCDQLTYTPLDGASASVIVTNSSVAKWKGPISTNNAVPQVAALLKLLTGTRGRTGRGRVYLPFADESVIDVGRLAGGTVSSMQSAWDTFRAAMTSASHAMVVASYVTPAARSTTAATVESLLATQRRRQPRPA